MTSLAVSLPGVRALETDAEQMAAAAHGDVEAFNGLVASHQDFLYGVAVWATGDAVLAEDALQDGLFRAYARAGLYRGEGPVRAWLARVVLNACRDAQRWHRRRRAEPLPAGPARSGPTPPATHTANSSSASVRASSGPRSTAWVRTNGSPWCSTRCTASSTRRSCSPHPRRSAP
jgi:DNA-directed RNA polymerase specialized sigma24 family protein